MRVPADMRFSVSASSLQETMKIQGSSNGCIQGKIGCFEFTYLLSVQQKNILSELSKYYTADRIRNFLVPVLVHKKTSLRSLDWLVTNYSKKFNILCRDKDGRLFNIHQGYRIALCINKRRNFDPFARKWRICVSAEDQSISTTVGQLNFLKWASENGVIEFLYANQRQIDKDMVTTSKRARQNRKENWKRCELTKPPFSKCTVICEKSDKYSIFN